MQAPISFSISGQQLWLSPLKAIFWENQNTLILSDLHFGKSGHFRKSGIAVPQNVYRNDLQRLFSLVQHYQPTSIIIVGDFFHSTQNKEAELFAKWRSDHSGIVFKLVRGNHDIFPDRWYQSNDIQIHSGTYEQSPFFFVHEWSNTVAELRRGYHFSGHIHPGVRFKGAGKQSLRLPCFYFEEQYAILPAFGDFTGLAIIEPKRDANVFVIAGNQVLNLQ